MNSFVILHTSYIKLKKFTSMHHDNRCLNLLKAVLKRDPTSCFLASLTRSCQTFLHSVLPPKKF